jgi:hypothetical protein
MFCRARPSIVSVCIAAYGYYLDPNTVYTIYLSLPTLFIIQIQIYA